MQRHEPETIAFGRRKSDGVLVHVSDVCRGLSCGVSCICCGSDLVARKGRQRRYHFAHAVDCTCEASRESSLHAYAKQVLLEHAALSLPDYHVTGTADDGRILSFTARLAETAKFTDVQIEPAEWLSVGGFKPDACCTRAAGPSLLVEFAFTHFVDMMKTARVAAVGADMVEVDLSGIDALGCTPDEITTQILFSAPRRWVWHSEVGRTDRRLAEAIAEANELLARRKAEAIASARQPRLANAMAWLLKQKVIDVEQYSVTKTTREGTELTAYGNFDMTVYLRELMPTATGAMATILGQSEKIEVRFTFGRESDTGVGDAARVIGIDLDGRDSDGYWIRHPRITDIDADLALATDAFDTDHPVRPIATVCGVEVGVPVTGMRLFAASPTVWQAALVREFFIGKSVNTKVSVDAVSAWAARAGHAPAHLTKFEWSALKGSRLSSRCVVRGYLSQLALAGFLVQGDCVGTFFLVARAVSEVVRTDPAPTKPPTSRMPFPGVRVIPGVRRTATTPPPTHDKDVSITGSGIQKRTPSTRYP